MRKKIAAVLLTGLAAAAAGCGNRRSQSIPVDEMPVVFRASFDDLDPAKWKAVGLYDVSGIGPGEKPGPWRLRQWLATDASAWKIARHGGNQYLSLHKQSAYEPKLLSPRNYILLPNVALTSFVLEVKVQSTSLQSEQRDLCILFGYQNPRQFYYAHIGSRLTRTGHMVLVVDGQPRRAITYQRDRPVVWGDAWHSVRVVRRWADGAVEVYFDDMSAPILTAHDMRFDLGRIGLGSFDDLGNFDDVILRGVRVDKLPPLNPEDMPPANTLRKAIKAGSQKPPGTKPPPEKPPAKKRPGSSG